MVIMAEVWGRGTNGEVKKKGLNRGSVQRPGDQLAIGIVESIISLKLQGERFIH